MKKGEVSGIPAFFAVAFVWFTTHFGGGFASGRQLIQFFVRYGWYALFTPVIAILLNAIVFYYAWEYSVEHKKFQYKSWCDSFYRPHEKIFSNLYELVFNLTLVTATAVAFATGGATMTKVLGTPYIVNTAIIAIIMLVLTIFGADVIRSVASWVAIVIILGLLIIYGTNFFVVLPNLKDVLSAPPAPYGFLPALWEAIKYTSLQAAVVGTYIAVADVLKNKSDIKKAAITGFLLNAVIITLASAVILSHYPTILTEAVPVIYVLNNGIGGSIGEMLVSLLIFLGVISTGVNLIYGGTKRILSVYTKEGVQENNRKKDIVASSVYVLITWGIALFGLIPLIAKGYSYISYIALPVVVIPIIYKGITRKRNVQEVPSTN